MLRRIQAGRSRGLLGSVGMRTCIAVPPPTLHFLESPDTLLQTAEPTVEVCEKLLGNLKTASTPGEKHDILDSVSNVLCLLLDPCEFVRQLHPSEEYKQAAMEAFNRGHEYMCEVNSRRDLYDVLVELSTPESMKALTPEQNLNVKQLKRDMESNGIHLPDKKRARITELNVEKEELAMRFMVNRDRSPFQELRNLLECRHMLAQELEFESYAEKELKGTMMGDQQSVWHFLCGIHNKYREGAELELEGIEKYRGEVKARDQITDEDRAKICAYLSNEAHPDEAANYFTVANCVRGIIILCEEVFGVKLKEMKFEDNERFNPNARKFHIHDENDKFLGVIILDMFASAAKHCQAGHLTVQLGCKPHVEVMKNVGLELPSAQKPIVVLTCNAGSGASRLSRRIDGSHDPELTIMKPHELTTCFHEFGHALHTIFAQTTVQNLSGTRGSIDFVETFSQLFEQFLTSYDFVKLWAKRVGTGEPITREIVEQRTKSINMFSHLDTLDQVNLASIDQVLHGPRPFTVFFANGPGGHIGKRTLGRMDEYGRGMYNLAKLMIDIQSPITLAKPTESGVLRSLSFEHLSTYPAGYYGYLYSLSVAKRIWHKKFEDKPLNREAGRELVDKVMRFGAACDQRQVIQDYLKDDLADIDVWA